MKNINGQRPTQSECNASLNYIADAMYVIGGKWKLRIIVSLTEGAKRFNELQRIVEGISAKVLSSELKDLELNGFIKRNIYTGIPVTVEYELTDYSDSLQNVLQALSAWGQTHRDNIKKSMKAAAAV